MAQQEEGWPLGLQPVNLRIGLVGNCNYSGSTSFTTLLSGSPTSSTDCSSDLDTESTGSSFFHDRSTTLGSLIGVNSIVHLSRRSIGARNRPQVIAAGKKSYRGSSKSKNWCFSLCPRDSTDAESVNIKNTPSLGQFLAVERRAAANEHRRSHSPINIYGPDDELALAQPEMLSNPLFVDGHIAPPCSSPLTIPDVQRRHSRGSEISDEIGVGGLPVFFPCICGGIN